jgi:hypothetical protein
MFQDFVGSGLSRTLDSAAQSITNFSFFTFHSRVQEDPVVVQFNGKRSIIVVSHLALHAGIPGFFFTDPVKIDETFFVINDHLALL